MWIFSRTFVVLVFVLFCFQRLTVGQPYEEDGDFDGGNPQQQQQQQQQITLTKEAIEKILSMLSGGCRAEMESALAMRGEISDECKIEIQNSMRKINLAEYTASRGASAEDGGENGVPLEQGGGQDGQRTRRKERTTTQESWINPYYAIAAFTILLFGSVIGYVWYFNSVATPDRLSAKPKKLSKKKEEKLRQKSGGRPL
jgi:hypothetical protein